MRSILVAVASGSVVLMLVTAAAAQSPRPAITTETSLGYAGFVDEVFVNHAVVGAGIRVSIHPRISIGPEVTYMRGPGDERNWFVTGNATFDLVQAGRPVTPYLIAGAGLMIQHDRFWTGRYSHTEGGLTGGAGVRFKTKNGWFVAPEMRTGWEPHMRYSVTIGRTF